MKISQIDTTQRKECQKFIDLPFLIYQNDPNWTPRLQSELHGVMDQHNHPLYEHSTAAFFIVEEGQNVLGRIAVLHHKNYSQYHGKEYAFFYYFDVINDPQAARLLFKAALDWCRDRNVEILLGPKPFSRSGCQGLLIDGFQYQCPVGVNYNAPYYPALVESAGLEKYTDYFSGVMTVEQQVDPRIHKIAEKLVAKGKFSVKNFHTKNEMKELIPAVRKVNEIAFRSVSSFMPSTEAEFTALAKDLILILEPGLPKLIYSGENIAGFVIAYSDIADGLRKSKGKLFPFGWIHLLWDQKHSKRIVLNGVGLLPEYQGLGANALLYSELEKSIRSRSRYQTAVMLQVEENNFRSAADMQSIGFRWDITHRVYQYHLR
ncbi:MAG: GNAT family N-acetyltransferase [Anaerolineaceae bacterium]|nr:GNAT family N-acetyltransferase [Anaerolineaceae bacterium]